jgi:hypothetical protein
MQDFLQILFAVCLVIILFVIGFAIYNYEFVKSIKLRSDMTLRETVAIFDGIKDLSLDKNETYTTTDKVLPSFRNINKSANQKGGIEFSYTFWLYVKPRSSSDCSTRSDKVVTPDEGFTLENIHKQTVLFVKGSKDLSTYNNICNKPKTDIMVKCPLVKLEQCGSRLTVEFNTLSSNPSGTDYVESIKQGSQNRCTDITIDWKRANSHKLSLSNLDRVEFANKWILVSVVLQDTSPTDPLPYRNKARCRIFINNFLELNTYVDGSLSPNKNVFSTINVNSGNLHVFPVLSLPSTDAAGGTVDVETYVPTNTEQRKLMMCNLTYYNYAIEQPAIEIIYTRGPSKYTAPSIGAKADYSEVSVVSSRYTKSMASDS